MFTYPIEGDAYLKILEHRDAEPVFILLDESRDYLREWLPFVDGTKGPDDVLAFIDGGLKQFAAGDGFHAGIWYQGNIAGVIGFHYFNRQNLSTSIGYWLGQKYQGKGLMTKAVSAMVDYALNVEGLNRVEIRCATENHKSRAIPERLGFTQEGCLRDNECLYGRFVDHIVYSILKKEWN